MPWQLNTTRDGGLTWKVEDQLYVFGAYFFLSEDKVENFKILSNIADVIAIMEGVSGLALLFLAILPRFVNRK